MDKNPQKNKILMLDNIEGIINRSYGMMISSKFRLNKALLARVHDSVAI
jgi:hypothetical protein